MTYNDERPNPDSLLNKVIKDEIDNERGKLKIFFGYAAGVGKTYAMLQSAHELLNDGIDVVVGYVEPHTRVETMALLDGLEKLDEKEVIYKGIKIKDFDLDLAIKRKPDVILVDELAHSNVSGFRNSKRWQDVEELILAGIDVYTTVNVQHIESLNDVVESITNVIVRETIPDRIINSATYVKVIDIEPEDLLERFKEGKVYREEQSKLAQNNFFKKENLDALREIALRRIAEKVNKEVQISRLAKGNLDICPTTEFLVVCISGSPTSQKVIRTAARMAESFRANWIAVYIESKSKNNFSLEESNQLRDNIALVESLGGEVVISHGEDMVKEVVHLAKFRNATKIIIGRNHKMGKRAFKRYYKKDIVDKIIESSDDIEVHVIPSKISNLSHKKRGKNNGLKKILPYVKFSWGDVIKSIGIIVLCTILSIVFLKFGFTDHNILLVYVIGGLFISVETNGYLIGVIAAFLNALVFNYCFTEPRLTFAIDDSSYILTLPFFILVSIITSTLTTKIKEEANSASEKEGKAQILYQISRSFLQIMGKENIINHGLDLINSSLQRNALVYFFEDEGTENKVKIKCNRDCDEAEFMKKNEKGVVEWVYKNNKIAGAGTETLPGASLYYTPIIGYKNTAGVIGIDCSEGLIDKNEQIFIESIIAQMALALDREELYRAQEKSEIEIEREKLRNNLLRAISHDLRTPLTGIVGSSSLILDSGKSLDEEVILDLIKGINEEGQWLIRLVENLLSMTKIDEGKLEIKKEMEVVEDVVYEAVNHVKGRGKFHNIDVKVTEEILVAPMDSKLICQVLINLIDNAIKYTPENSNIIVNSYLKKKFVVFEVSDNGEGISKEYIGEIFNQFFIIPNSCIDSKRGIGLGLAICKSIVDAHGGSIEVFNNKNGGATFKFTIPLEI